MISDKILYDKQIELYVKQMFQLNLFECFLITVCILIQKQLFKLARSLIKSSVGYCSLCFSSCLISDWGSLAS